MASSTLKSHHQLLHNFPLQDLKWSMNNTTGNSYHHYHRFRKSPHQDSAITDASDDVLKTEKLDNFDKKSKICFRIKTKNSSNSSSIKYAPSDDDDDVVDAVAGDHNSSASVVMDDVEETLTKTWNLRPRKPVINKKPSSNNNNNNNGGNGGGVSKAGIGAVSQEIKTQEPSRTELTRSQRYGNIDSKMVGDKKEKDKGKKVKFSIPLTKQEIEEDVYALTGSKPARRPKKRAKYVQKQLDCLFPGLWLASVTPDVYRVPDAPPKG